MATVQAIVLKFESPSSRMQDGDQQWSCKFHLSGAAIASESEAEATALGLAAPILSLIVSEAYLSGWLYYPANSTINTYQQTYLDTDHPGTALAYTDASTGQTQQVEVCALLRAPTKPNSKGRMGYLFKYVHAIVAKGPDMRAAQEIQPLAGNPLTTYNTGVDSADRIPVAPDGTVPSGDWIVHEFLVTRQMRRGQAPKA